MSDEFLEGRSLRGHRRDDEISSAGALSPDKHDPLTDELPFIVLTPPPEAGDVITPQTVRPTRPTPRPRFTRPADPNKVDYEIVETPDLLNEHPEEESEESPKAPVSEADNGASEKVDLPPVALPDEGEEPLPLQFIREPPLPVEPPAEPVMRLPRLIIDEEDEDDPLETTPMAPAASRQKDPPGRFEDVTGKLASENPDPLPLRPESDHAPTPEPAGPPPDFVPRFQTTDSGLPPVPSLDDDGLVIKRPQDTLFDSHPITAEVIIDPDEDFEPVPLEPEVLTARPSHPPEEEPRVPRRSRWGMSAVLTLAGFVVITLALIFLPGLIALLQEGSEAPPASVANPPAVSIPTIDPDGSMILLTPTAAPVLQRAQIAYASTRNGSFDIYLLDLSTGESVALTDNPSSSDRSPSWSPDGSQLAFVSDRDGSDNLYLMNADGSGLVQLTDSTAADRSPAWSPDGQSIIFSRETVEGSLLFSFNVAACGLEAGGCEDDLQAITEDRFSLNPSWSPDGRYIAFTSLDFPGLPSVIGILDTLTDRYSALEGTGGSDFFPAWSPADRAIAFVTLGDLGYDIWVMTPAGSNLVQLTDERADDVEPAWSPDGTQLIFASNLEGASFDLYAISVSCPDGTFECEHVPVRLTDNAADELNPAWRPGP